MILKGFCVTQNKQYEISVKSINASATDDVRSSKKVVGRIDCKYAGFHDCNIPCSILAENNCKQG